MFLILMETATAAGGEWSVMAHGKNRLRTLVLTREAAEEIATDLAEVYNNRFSVVEVKSWFRQEIKTVVEETRIG